MCRCGASRVSGGSDIHVHNWIVLAEQLKMISSLEFDDFRLGGTVNSRHLFIAL